MAVLPSSQIRHRNKLLWVINDTAKFLQSQSQLQQAEELYRIVVAVREETLGNDHPDTLCAQLRVSKKVR